MKCFSHTFSELVSFENKLKFCTLRFIQSTNLFKHFAQLQDESAGLLVMGGDSYMRGLQFESKRQFQKTENKLKRAQEWPH